jgi:adenosyl cobinamide kinase/adenosyl cobinamide phosphate guanylyltransferase
MVYLIIGEQNTGKSFYYERVIEQYQNILYFGTLWESEDTLHIIERHKKRRKSSWINIESTGDIAEDKSRIVSSILGLSETPHCMIDGLVNWALFCSKKDRFYKSVSENLAKVIIELVTTYHDVNWYLLENLRSDYFRVPVREMVWDALINEISAGIEKLEIIHWEVAK